MERSTKLILASGLIGLTTLLGGILLSVMVKKEIQIKMKKVMPLKEGSYSYDPWLDPPLPIFFKMYMFDLKNPTEVIEKGAKPFFEEKGPYTYRLIPEKVNVTFNKNATVTYREQHTYLFQRNMSVGPATDRFITLNLPLLTLTTLIRNEYKPLTDFVKLFLNIDKSYSLFVNVSVQEFMWGYEDPVLKVVRKILSEFDIPFDDHFGLFYKINGTDNGEFNVYSGEKDLRDFTRIHTWNGNTSLSKWSTNQSNMINGTDGHLFNPFVDKEKDLYFFYTYIQRSIYVSFQKEVTNRGIKLYRFIMPDRVFDSTYPENAGFCIPRGHCPPVGLLDLSHVTIGAPVVVSQPHFLGASMAVQNNVGGLNPDREKHQCYDDIEPTIGVVLNAQNPIQINGVLEKTPIIEQTAKLKDKIYFPLVWFMAKSDLTDELANELKDKFLTPLSILHTVTIVSIGCGGFIMICVVLLTIRKICLSKKVVPSEKSKLLTSHTIQ